MPKGLASSRIIVNANAPICEIKIVIDNRYSPAEVQMISSHPMPAVVVAAHLNNCLGNVLGMMVQVGIQEVSKQPADPPDLPPAPDPSQVS